jgi:hypothetical protein
MIHFFIQVFIIVNNADIKVYIFQPFFFKHISQFFFQSDKLLIIIKTLKMYHNIN